MPSRWTLPANGERPSDRKHLIRVNSIIQNYDLPIKVWEMRAYEQSGAAAADNTSNVTGDFWISSTGKTHRGDKRAAIYSILRSRSFQFVM